MLRKKRHTLATIAALGLTTALVLAPMSAMAAIPGPIGEEGTHTTITRNETVRSSELDFITQQHVMRQGWNNDFYAGITDGSTNKDSEFYIYRYFEDETKPVTSWHTAESFAASSGTDVTLQRPLGLASDSVNHALYTIHRSDHSAGSGPHTIVEWDEDGNYVDHWSFEFGFGASVHAMQYDPATGTLVITVDAPMATDRTGLYEFDLNSGTVSLLTTQNKESAFEGKTQLDISDDGLIYFQNTSKELGIYNRDSGSTTYAGYPQSITGMTAQNGELVVSTLGYEVFEADLETGEFVETIIPTSTTDFDRAFATIKGNDGRYYVSSAETPPGHQWQNGGVYSVEFDSYELSLAQATYPETVSTLNVCSPTSLAINPELGGSPLPTWFEITNGALPDGVGFANETGKIDGQVSPDTQLGDYSVTVMPHNGVTPVTSTQTTGTAHFEVVEIPVAFDLTSTPEITGDPTVGSTLTSSQQAWEPAQQLSYQWYRDGAAIEGATESSYTLQPADAGTSVSVTATGSGDCLEETTTTSAQVAVAATPTDPGNPTDPGIPTDPGNPTDPSTPTDPKIPTGPTNPDVPAGLEPSPGQGTEAGAEVGSTPDNAQESLPTTGTAVPVMGWAAAALALSLGGLLTVFLRRQRPDEDTTVSQN